MLVPRHLLDRNPFTLRGGEAKRVSMASVLALDQPAWLLDEPFDYLDSEGVRAVLKLIQYGLSRDKVIIVATANAAYLHFLKPAKVILLSKGSITFEDDLETLTSLLLEEHGVPSTQQLCSV